MDFFLVWSQSPLGLGFKAVADFTAKSKVKPDMLDLKFKKEEARGHFQSTVHAAFIPWLDHTLPNR